MLFSKGVTVTASVESCDTSRYHGACLLNYTYRGKRSYEEGIGGMGSARNQASGSKVPVLVNPEDPSTVATAYDVRTNRNAGFGLVAGIGLLAMVLSIILLVGFAKKSREFNRRAHSEAPLSK